MILTHSKCFVINSLSQLFGWHCLFMLIKIFQGPPPDPQYNFLSDRARDKPRTEFKDRKQGEKENRNGDRNNNNKEGTRRHPKNFGGTDFNNVKPKMKEVKERQVCEIFI